MEANATFHTSFHSSRLLKHTNNWMREGKSARRVEKTQLFCNDYIAPFFGDLRSFETALREAKSEEYAQLREEDAQRTLQAAYVSLRRGLRQLSPTLLMQTKLSRVSWTLLRANCRFNGLPIFPCYHTLSRHWSSQELIPEGISDADFFDILQGGSRTILSLASTTSKDWEDDLLLLLRDDFFAQDTDAPPSDSLQQNPAEPSGDTSAPLEVPPSTTPALRYRISLLDRLRWILFLFATYCCKLVHAFLAAHSLPVDHLVTIQFRFLLWDDGGQVWGLRNGLFSAMKAADIYVTAGEHVMKLPSYWNTFFVGRSWTLSVEKVPENYDNVGTLHLDLMRQWDDFCQRPSVIRYGSYEMIPSFVGFAADHGTRSKCTHKDCDKARCGECGTYFDRALSDAGDLYFLDWDYLLDLVEVTPETWDSTRYRCIPEHIRIARVSIMSYDNMHNFVGHLKDLFGLISQDFSDSQKAQVEELLAALTGLDKRSRAGKVKYVWEMFKCWQWRLCSLYFNSVFEDQMRTDDTKEAFRSLFDLLAEIHLMNYIHFDVRDPDYPLLHLRYFLLLYLYTEQLKEIWTNNELGVLNTSFLHKILVHSLRMFKSLCLASCSAEQGEGKISSVNAWTRVCSGHPEFYARKIAQHCITQEEEIANHLRDVVENNPVYDGDRHADSRVFYRDYMENYIVRDISIRLEARTEPSQSAIIMHIQKAVGFSWDELVTRNLVSVKSGRRSHLVFHVSDAFQCCFPKPPVSTVPTPEPTPESMTITDIINLITPSEPPVDPNCILNTAQRTPADTAVAPSADHTTSANKYPAPPNATTDGSTIFPAQAVDSTPIRKYLRTRFVQHLSRPLFLTTASNPLKGVEATKMGLYRLNLKIQALRSHHQHLLKHLSFLAGHLTQLEDKFQCAISLHSQILERNINLYPFLCPLEPDDLYLLRHPERMTIPQLNLVLTRSTGQSQQLTKAELIAVLQKTFRTGTQSRTSSNSRTRQKKGKKARGKTAKPPVKKRRVPQKKTNDSESDAEWVEGYQTDNEDDEPIVTDDTPNLARRLSMAIPTAAYPLKLLSCQSDSETVASRKETTHGMELLSLTQCPYIFLICYSSSFGVVLDTQ